VTIKVGGAALAAPPAATDPRLDLALLAPAQKVDGGLRVWAGDDLVIGEPVVAWGYPAGYDGAAPLLTAGYLSGVGAETTGPVSVPRGLVNGAFNLGNSGGPLIDVRTLTVVGVVASKLAPVPRDVETALSALAAQKGLGFTARTADGKELQVSEAQVVARVLQYLRQQTQLAIGLVVLPTDLKSFLRANAVTP
jgi:S1-C subfamily serine protease